MDAAVPLSELQRDEVLLELHRDVGVVKHATGTIRVDTDDLKKSMSGLQSSVVEIATRQEDHTGRIHLLETKHDDQGKALAVVSASTGQDRAKLSGIWVGVTALIAIVVTAVNIVISLMRK